MPKNIPPTIPHRPPATYFLDMYVTSNRQEIGKTKFCSHIKKCMPSACSNFEFRASLSFGGAILPPMHNRVNNIELYDGR